MNFPDKVKVGGHEYKVIFPYTFTERSDNIGQADHDMLEIRLSEKDGYVTRADSCLYETFIHEIIHCISEIWRIDLEEKQVTQLGEGLLAVLVDNGWLKINK